MSDKPNFTRLTTPVGTAKYPHLLEMDKYQLKEHGKQEFNTKLILAADESDFVEAVNAEAQAAFDAAVEKLMEGDGKKKALAKKLELYVPYDMAVDDEGDETGEYEFKMKCAAGGTNKDGEDWSKELPIFDAEGQPVKGDNRKQMKLWGGSRIAVAIQCIPFMNDAAKNAGVSLRITAVQVIEAKGGADQSADSFGFGVVEGGFKADTFDNAAASDSPTEEPEEDDDF